MKKLPTLHILNGDASLPAFKVADLPGQVLVWREILASGPAVYSMPQESFWQLRKHYITDTFRVSEEDYNEKVLNELIKLENASYFFEVVLWFDKDMVCQVNLLYLLYKLFQNRPAVISVCTSAHGSLGFKKHEELQHLFEHRSMLQEADLEQATLLWKLYAGPDPIALQLYIQENTLYSQHLQQALLLHLQRFPAQNSYLGKSQELLLRSAENGASTLTDIQKSFWQQDPGFGFGDWELKAILKELSPELIRISESEITLTESGKMVLANQTKFRKNMIYWLGGVQVEQQNPSFCFNSITNQLMQCTSKFIPE
jgi:hypothetical protein